jgi:hypothetical protein
MDSSTTGPIGLNAHAHSEQAQPWKIWLSTHTSLRRIALIASLETCGDHASLKSGLALFFNDTATKKAGLFMAPDEVLPNRRPLNAHQKSK